MIIGVTGEYGAGKDSVAMILQELGFEHISLSDFVREELRARGEKVTRKNMIQAGDELRKKEGADILARKAFKQMKQEKKYVITSFRNIKEVEYFRNRGIQFYLVYVTAPESLRVQRLKHRNREEDPTSVSELRERENQENSINEWGMQLAKVRERAQRCIVNDGTMEELRKKVIKMLHSV